MDHDKQNGSIFSISGPVIVAENMIGVAMYELVIFYETMGCWPHPSVKG